MVCPIPKTPEEALQWLLEQDAIPVWDPGKTEGNVHFRRIRFPKHEAEKYKGLVNVVRGKHIAGRETRKRIVELLGIRSKQDCKDIKKRLYDLGL
jgi:hypothetical protein